MATARTKNRPSHPPAAKRDGPAGGVEDRIPTLEAAVRARDDLLSIVSHDLRSPLSTILTWINLIRGGHLDATRTERALETIERSAQHQARLLDRLLDVSRMLGGRLTVDLVSVDLRAVTAAAVAAAQSTAEAKGVRLDAAMDDGPIHVLGDASRLTQIVDNLLVNAIKFTPEGGSVRLRLDRDGGQGRIAVSDSGPGVPAALLPHAFDRFRQGDRSSIRRPGGLGVGLTLVRHLIELHGGSVAAENIKGSGALFTVTLPVDSTALDAPSGDPTRIGKRPVAPARLRDLTVLVVDDEAPAREAMATALSVAGANVVVAASAIEALEVLGSSIPDVLVSDIAMPDADGHALIRRIRAPDAGDRGLIPAIAVSGFTGSADRQRALAAGFQVHLAKPVDPDELIATISRLVRGVG